MRKIDLKPDYYTVDADFTNMAEGDPDELGYSCINAIVACADDLGFVVVRNSFDDATFAHLQSDVAEALADGREQKKLERIDSPHTAVRVDKTSERYTRLCDDSWGLLGGVALRLQQASRHRPFMATDHHDIASAYVLRMLYRGEVAAHRDKVTGVMCETSFQGTAMMKIESEDFRAHVELGPNDTLIMPAYTQGSRTHKRPPVKHNVVNTTGVRKGRGRRISLLYGYGRQTD